MTRSEIKRRIAELIGKTYQAFSSYKTADGTELKVHGEKMEIGVPIYVITPEGELPAPEMEYEMEDGIKVEVKEGIISNIEDGLLTEGTPVDETAPQDSVDEVFDSAVLVDGTKIEADGAFEVGKELYVITEEGEKVSAPEGEHTTDSGIVLVVNSEGVITGIRRPDGEAEGSLVEASKEDVELLETFTAAINKLTDEIESLRKENKEIQDKFSKFAAQPAGEKVFDRKGYIDAINQSKFSKIENIALLRAARNK